MKRRSRSAFHTSAATVPTTAVLSAVLLAMPLVSCDTSTGPDGAGEPHEVVFLSTMGGGRDLWAARSDGTGLVQITDDDIDERWFAVSPDGRRVAVLRTDPSIGTDLYIIDRETGEMVNLTNSPEQWDGWMSWSPDGTRIVFDEPNESLGGSDIYVANADGSGVTNLTPPEGGPHEGGAVWSPDGSRLAFVSLRDGGQPDIFVMDADGSDVVNVTASPDSEEKWPSWSPDGARIAFSRSAGGFPRDIYVIDPDGTDLRNVTQNPVRNDEVPLWSPGGTRLMFMATVPDGEPDIMVQDVDGIDAVNVSDHPAADDYASWSPDGSLIAFTSFRDGIRQVYVVGADGTELRRLASPPDSDTRESWLESMAAWGPGER